MCNYKEKIEEILFILTYSKEFFPEISGLFESAINGVEDSKQRVLIGQTRLARRARLSVASCAASILGPVLEIGNLSDNLLRQLTRLTSIVREISSDIEFEGEGIPDIPTPRGWKKTENAFAKTFESGDSFFVTRREHLPGGEWTLFYFSVPVYTGKTVYEATQMADKLRRMQLRQQLKRQTPNVATPELHSKKF